MTGNLEKRGKWRDIHLQNILGSRLRTVQGDDGRLLDGMLRLCTVWIACRWAHEVTRLETDWAASARWALTGFAKRIARLG